MVAELWEIFAHDAITVSNEIGVLAHRGAQRAVERRRQD
jgi:hypothetical protein